VTDTPAPGGETAAPVPSAPPHARRQNGMGTAALVIGVVALVLAVLFIFAPLGGLLGLIATVLGILGIARANQGLADNRGQALAGLITGLLGLALGIAITIGVGTFLASHVTDLNRFGSCLDNAASSQARESCAREFADRLDN
jgi:Na+/H+ antiporter NhaD/arsenite permease-like protein